MKYKNRELSWLQFNARVLEESLDEQLTLKERLKFISIFSSNLDEFFMVRVGSLNDQMNAGFEELDIAGLTPAEQLKAIRQESYRLQQKQNHYFQKILETAEAEGLKILTMEDLKEDEKKTLDEYFRVEVYPVLTPLATDHHRPFPLISNQTLYLAVKVLEGKKQHMSLLQIPGILPRLVPVTRNTKKSTYVFLEDLIIAHLSDLYVNLTIESVSLFRITRNGDLNVDEEEAEDLLSVIESSLQQRRWGEVIRLELLDGFDEVLLPGLMKNLQVREQDVFRFEGPLDLKFAMNLEGPIGSKVFRAANYEPKRFDLAKRRNLFSLTLENDLFFHVPYDSFRYIEQMIVDASEDPNVLAIKMTLYRVNDDSKIVRALTKAALDGKQVTVLVELMARFDEENNINWARQLERVGANVIYGVPGVKTHSKIFLIVRRERGHIRRYVHLGTGNYNSKTARLYTDMSVLTAREDIASDASTFFNIISGYASEPIMKRLVYAPVRLRNRLEQLIDNEIRAALDSKSASICIKVNSLVDDQMINKLYEASNAGVKVNLIVRGICSLIPGIKGQSENIKVKSIVGEFLEHERIYLFENAAPDDTFLSSADLMTRNLDRRIELMFPIIDKEIRKRVRLSFEVLWKDSRKSWYLTEDGSYRKHDGAGLHAHEVFKELTYQTTAEANKKLEKIVHDVS